MSTQAHQIPLDIIEINTGSLRSINKRQDMANFLKNFHPDIVLVTETAINQHHNVAFRNYLFTRNDKIPNEPGRGTGILVKNTIKHDPVDTTSWNLKTLETSAVTIHTMNSQLLIVCAYRYNGGNASLETEDIDKIVLEFRMSNASQLVIGGDLNAKHINWGNNTNCRSGLKLDHWLQNNQDFKLIRTKEATFYKLNYASFLDVFIVSSNVNIIFPASHPNKLEILDYPSDHRAVRLKIFPENSVVPATPRRITKFQDTDWKHFNTILDTEWQDINIPNHADMSTNDIDMALQFFSDKVNETIKKIVPTTTIQQDTQTPLPQDILDLIKYKNNLRRRWQRNRYSYFDHQLKSEINCITKIIAERIKIHNTMHWEKTLKSVKLDNHTFRNIKKFAGTYKRNIIPPLNIQGTTNKATTDKDKANAIGTHFELIHRQNLQIGSALRTSNINNEIKNNFNNFTPRYQFNVDASANSTYRYDENRHLISTSNLCSILRTRANKRSVGTDNIPNIVLKRMSYKSKILVTMLFNHMFNIGYFPKAWKCAITIPIPKKDKNADAPNSYRPIALLPCLSKIYESAVKEHLMKQCVNLNVLPPDQFGSVKLRTTVHPLVKFSNDIASGINRRTPTIACALDVEKAFDTVWHEGLLHKMHFVYGFSQHLCKVLYHYLSERSYVIKINDTLSKSFPIAAGVPQGGVLSAILYSIFIADLPVPPEHINKIQRLQYADDTLMYVSVRNLKDGQDRLNDYLKALHEFYEKWKIKLNLDKAEAIVFKGPNKYHSKSVNKSHRDIQLKIANHNIALKDQIKYLGVIHTQQPKHIAHINYIIDKAQRAFQAIRPVLKRTSGLNIRVKLLCYKQLIRPVLAYAFAAWSNISSHQMERLRVTERKVLRMCINYTRPRHSYYHISNTSLYKAADIDRIDVHLCNNALRLFEFWPDLELLENCINQDGNHLDDPNTPFKTPWYLEHLNNTNRLFLQNTPVYYHRRHRIDGNANLVYSTST